MDVMLDFSQKVSFVRYINNAVLATRFTIRADVLPMDGVEEIDIDISLAKIKFWYETVVSRSVVFGRHNEMAWATLLDDDGKPRVTNTLMVTPDEPNDDHLASLMQSKMAALSKGRILFPCVRLK